ERKVAATPPHAATPSAATSLASTGVLDNVSDLSDDEVRALTASLDHLSALPEADPSPGVDPLGASLDDASAGGGTGTARAGHCGQLAASRRAGAPAPRARGRAAHARRDRRSDAPARRRE